MKKMLTWMRGVSVDLHNHIVNQLPVASNQWPVKRVFVKVRASFLTGNS